MDQRRTWLAATALLVLFAAGIVLAFSWAVAFPGVILATAWLVAFVAMAVLIGSAFLEARYARVGFVAAVGRSFKALGRFILWFL
jgi:hypothetical protein